MEWEFVVKRNLSILFLEFISGGQIESNMKKIGLNYGINRYRSIEGRISDSVEDINNCIRVLKEKYSVEGTKFLRWLLQKWDDFTVELERISLDISNTDYSNKNKEDLINAFEELEQAYYQMSTSLYSQTVIERLADEIIKRKLENHSLEKSTDYFNILTSTNRDNESTKELISILNIAVKLKKEENISDDVKNHIKEFGWINTRGFYGNAWPEDEIKQRLKFMLENPEERLKGLKEHLNKIDKETERILSKINADDEFRALVNITKEFVYYRTHRMDVYVKCGFLARPLFKEIAKRINLEMHDILYLTTTEIKDALVNNKVILENINERKKEFGFIRDHEKISILTSRELEDYKEKYCRESIDKSITEIKGTMASAGLVRGIAKVLAGKEELHKVETGDVLVTSMTTPDFIIAMEKAVAFVTDEGGILCHAAIVSREMGKPCIIGTNIASKVLKDGDLLEVNANEGIVKIIKRK
jgi:phosphoenolpyruvate synthase/pyruvate phosphate dikinase